MHEFNLESNAWTQKANLPYTNHRQCGLADEEDDKIWMIGGHTCGAGDRNEVYYYTVSSNAWTFHSHMYGSQTSIDPACGIIRRKTGEKWLIVVRGGRSEAVTYYDLTNGNYARVICPSCQRALREAKSQDEDNKISPSKLQ